MAKILPLHFPGCFLLLLVITSLADSQLDQGARDSQPGVRLPERGGQEWNIDDTIRRSRALSKTALGVAAAQKLIAGAKKVKTNSKSFKTYSKEGTYSTALADFNSVKPKLKKPNSNRIVYGRPKWIGSVLVGKVGDTRIILMPNGDHLSKGVPVIEVRPALDPLYTRIEYSGKTPKP